MKLNSLKTIEHLLREKAENAEKEYHKQKTLLEDKYHTEWINGHLTPEESSLLDTLKAEWYKFSEALDDFLQHQWK